MTCTCPTCGQALPHAEDLLIDPAGILVRRGRAAVLTANENTVFEKLHVAGGRVVSREALLTAIYPLEQDEAQIKIIDVWICKMRKKLKPLGVEVANVWGRGYRLIIKAPEEREAA